MIESFYKLRIEDVTLTLYELCPPNQNAMAWFSQLELHLLSKTEAEVRHLNKVVLTLRAVNESNVYKLLLETPK